jgi:hypothetical protein
MVAIQRLNPGVLLIFLNFFILRFHQIINKECLEYSANSETGTDIENEENTEGRRSGLPWNRHCHKNSPNFVETVGQ